MDGLLEPEVKGVADKGMPDRHLVEPRHGLVEVLEVFEREVVSGIYPQAEVVSEPRSLDIRCDGGSGVGGEQVGIGLGVQLDAVGAGGGGGAVKSLREVVSVASVFLPQTQVTAKVQIMEV